MIKKIYSEENKSIVYAHKLMGEDYQILSETFQIPEEKIKNITNEEIFTPSLTGKFTNFIIPKLSLTIKMKNISGVKFLRL